MLSRSLQSASDSRSHGERRTPDGELGHDSAKHRAARRDQEEKADRVSDEAGGQQEGAADDHHRPVEGLARGNLSRRDRLVEAPPGSSPLVPQERSAEE